RIFGAAPARGGRPWRPVAHPAPLEALLERYAEIKRVHLQRLPVIQPYFFAVLGLLGAGGLASAGMRAGIVPARGRWTALWRGIYAGRSEEHTSELQSRENLVCRPLRAKKEPTARRPTEPRPEAHTQ